MSPSTCLQPLRLEFDRERPNVLVVVGAGVSYGATGEARASWRGLLEHGIETLRSGGAWRDDVANANLTLIRKAFSSDFDLDDVLGGAERIAKALEAPSGASYAAWLEAAVGSLQARAGRTATLDAIKHLEQAGALILTTNYDDLLGDATGLEPVTWQDHRELLRVLNREREGVLHIHGHWRTPSSVILGRRSYEQIVATKELQELFQSIWMHWSWLYVGCGNGLEDPNVGRLLRWGQAAFGESGRKHFFLAQEQAAAELSVRSDKPGNLIPVGYSDHADLPELLEELTPRRRPAPFVKLGPAHGPVRLPSTSPLDIPLPSWRELLVGEVPPLSVDTAVSTALAAHGWALVYDVASVGKTTLVLRLAAASENRGRPAYYLDVARVDALDEDESARIRAAARRLANANALVILDNAHWAPQLARELWEWWLSRPRASQLLLAATRVQYTAGVSGDDGLTVVENHPGNPAIALRVLPADMQQVLNSIVKRVSGRDAALAPPATVLATWHATFANEMGAFAAAITSLHQRLAAGQWELPLSAAAQWMRNRHLSMLDAEEVENAICISVFASQELEMQVAEHALPHPGKMVGLLKRGLAERRELGRGRYRAFALREPDWGPLILAAVEPLPARDAILLQAVSRYMPTALALSVRFARLHDHARQKVLWRHLSGAVPVPLAADQLLSHPLLFADAFFAKAFTNGEPAMVDRLWEALEEDPDRLAQRAFETQLGHLASFIDTALTHKRSALVDGLWQALEKDPDRLAQRAFQTPFHFLASFINRALAQKRATLVDGLWQALEEDADGLAQRALETPLDSLASFIDTALAQNKATLVDGLWQALEKDPDGLAQRAFEMPLGHLAFFIDTASTHKRSTLMDGLWQALENDPDGLAQRAFETPLDHLASFIDTALAQNKATLVDGLWQALEKDPDGLAQRAFETPLDHLASFIDTALAQNKATLVCRLWQALEEDPDRLAQRVLETPLDHLASFIDTALTHKRSTLVDGLWQALEKDLDRLQSRVALLSGGSLFGFLKRAPATLGSLAIAKLDVADWAPSGQRVLKGFWGASRLASQFVSLGRKDLALALRGVLLQDPTGHWFSAPYAAMVDVAMLLRELTQTEQHLVAPFVERLCSSKWLRTQYLGKTDDGTLAGALVLLALSQPPAIISRFRAPPLRARIEDSLGKLRDAASEALSELIQLLGAVQLVGQRLPRAPFADAHLDRIARLPLDVLPHRPEAEGIEHRQRSLWLGLRVASSLAAAPIVVGTIVINETVDRWRLTAGGGAQSGAASHRLDASMIAWLEACSRNSRGALVPSREPLWLLAGFGRDPDVW